MTTQQYNNKNEQVNDEDDMDMCGATYLIIDSISTHYVDFDDNHMGHEIDNQESITDDIANNGDDVIKALQTMELMDSASNHTVFNERIIQAKAKEVDNCMIKDNTVLARKYEKHNINQKTKETDNFKSQTMPPKFSRWLKTLNKAQEILDQGTDIPTDSIAKHLHEKHTHETYVESLCKITDTNSLLFKEIEGIMQVKTNNGILQVPMDHFHSYKHSDNGVQCLLCDTILPEKDADMHKYEVRHMNHVVKVVDHRGMRKIDYKYSHCITCNLKIIKRKGTAAHIKSSPHIQARKLYIKTNVRKVAALGLDGKGKVNLMMDVASCSPPLV